MTIKISLTSVSKDMRDRLTKKMISEDEKGRISISTIVEGGRPKVLTVPKSKFKSRSISGEMIRRARELVDSGEWTLDNPLPVTAETIADYMDQYPDPFEI